MSDPSGKIVFIDQDELQNKDIRKQVRSRAAQHSHHSGLRKPRVSKKKAGERSRSQRPASSATPSSSRSAGEGDDSEASEPPSPSVDTVNVQTYQTGRRQSTLLQRSPLRRTIRSLASERSFGRGKQRMKEETRGSLVPDNTPTSPTSSIQIWPVPILPWYPEILDQMWDFVFRSWPHLQGTSVEEECEGIAWVKSLTLSEPAFFYANMLSVCSDLVSKGMMDSDKETTLSDHLVSAVNLALGNSDNLRNIGLILAVGRLAFREIVLGNRDVGERVHRPAFAKLVAIAGGLDALQLPTAVHAIVLWADRCLTQVTGLSMADIDPAAASARGSIKESTEEDMRMLNSYRTIRQRRNNACRV